MPSKRNCMWTLPGETGALSSDDEEAEALPAAKRAAPEAPPKGRKAPAAVAEAPKTVMGPPPPPEAPAAAAMPPPPAARPPPAAAAPAAPAVDLGRYADAAALEALGLDALKAELSARGLKCGGTLAERAARLFLLKHQTLAQLDAKHKAPPPKR